MELNEAEIQILACLDMVCAGGMPAGRKALEKSGERYSEYLEDWSDAFASLAARGLIAGDERGFQLTAATRPLAQAYNHQRADRYWYYYRTFYPAAYASAAHSKLCERAFGLNLCQEGQVDMAALHDVLSRLDLAPGDHVLDLGCGAGVISKYISDTTGTIVTGVDNAASAVDAANERTLANRDRLKFVQGDISSLDFPAQSFDAVISLDTLYWVNDLGKAILQIVEMLEPGGRIAIFISAEREDDDPPEMVAADTTDLARALNELGLAYETYDYTDRHMEFWRHIGLAAADLRDDFEAEGNVSIADSLARESANNLPRLKAGTMRRYFYHVRLEDR